MTRLSDYAKTRITLLHEQLYRINEIVRTLENEDVHTTRQTVAKFIRKHKLRKFLIYFAIFRWELIYLVYFRIVFEAYVVVDQPRTQGGRRSQ